MENPTISIVIPVYNVEKYVKETLLSIKNQSLEPDEVIIINDGSTDKSLTIVNEFNNINNWKIFNTKNQGLGLTRNYGKSLAKSEYVYFIDSDDILEKNFIFEIKSLIKFYKKPDIILFSGKTFSKNNKNNNKNNLKFTIEGQFFRDDNLLTKLVNKNETLPQASRYITKKSLWDDNNLNYPPGIAEDEGVFFPLISLSKNTVVNTNSFYRYRVNRPGSITSDKPKPIHSKDYLNRILFTIKFMKSYKKIINNDLYAWNNNLQKKCLKYVNICLKTKSTISWKIIFIIIFKTKNFIFFLKILWRVIKNVFKN